MKFALKKQGGMYLFVGILCVIILTIGFLYRKKRAKPVHISNVYVINMDKSKDRWDEVKVAAEKADVPIKRWRAVDGKQIGEDDARRHNVSKLIVRHTKEKMQPGVVGCYLSHKTLLQHLETQSAHSADAHLILEDDAAIPVDFWEQWNTFAAELPADWDIVQICVTYPNLRQMDGC